jgi:hypothetical protein
MKTSEEESVGIGGVVVNVCMNELVIVFGRFGFVFLLNTPPFLSNRFSLSLSYKQKQVYAFHRLINSDNYCSFSFLL